MTIDINGVAVDELDKASMQAVLNRLQVSKKEGSIHEIVVKGSPAVLTNIIVDYDVDVIMPLPGTSHADLSTLCVALAHYQGVQVQATDNPSTSSSDELQSLSFWSTPPRCSWVDNPLLAYYHDAEWGVTPDTDERWFEFVVLETFQAGLSWKTILNKRKAFRKAFVGFSIDKVAAFTENDVERLMGDAGIIRNRKKIEATIENAKIAQQLVVEYGSFAQFVADQVRSAPDPLKVLQQTFRFVGRTTAESIVFATGIVKPPHSEACWKNHSD